MNLNNRISKLETKQGGGLRYFYATPKGDNYLLKECKLDGESRLLSEQELGEWQRGQGNNVCLIKLVHPPLSEGFKP